MKRASVLLALAVVSGCASPSASPVLSAGPSASPLASTGAPVTSEVASGTAVTCTLPADVCGDAIRAVEAVPALNRAGMPPAAVAVLDFSDCRSVKGAPSGFDPCAASMPMPAEPSAIGGGDGIATVTYRNGLGTAFLYVWWRTFASGRGPINALVEWHNP